MSFQERMALVESLAAQLSAAMESASELEGSGERDVLARARAYDALMDAAYAIKHVAVAA